MGIFDNMSFNDLASITDQFAKQIARHIRVPDTATGIRDAIETGSGGNLSHAEKARLEYMRKVTSNIETSMNEFEKLSRQQKLTLTSLKNKFDISNGVFKQTLEKLEKLPNLEDLTQGFKIQDNVAALKNAFDYIEKTTFGTANDLKKAFIMAENSGIHMADVLKDSLNASQFKKLKIIINKLSKDKELTEAEVKKLANAIKNTREIFSSQLSKATDNLMNFSQELEKNHRKGFLEKSGDALNGFTGKVLSASFAVKALSNIADDVRATMEFGGNLKFFDVNALSLGVSLAELSKIQAQNRQAMFLLGGSSNMAKALSEQQMRFVSITGDFNDALEVSAASLTNLTRVGQALTPEKLKMEMGKQVDTLKIFRDQVGMSAKEAASFFRGLAEDGDVRVALQKINERDRLEHFKTIQLRVAENKVMGMSIDKAREAAIAMDKIAGLSPKERFKVAARAQALGGILGVGGGENIAAIIRKGARATPEEQKSVQEFFQKANDMASSMQQGSIAQEQLVYSIQSQMGGMDNLFGPRAAFNTVLEKSAQAQQNVVKQFSQQSELTKFSQEVLGWTRYIKGIYESTGGMLAAMVAGLFISKFGGPALSALGRVLGGKGIADAAGGLAGGKLLKFAKGAGAAGAAVLGVQQAGQAIFTGESDVHKMLQTAAPGVESFIGNKIGTALDLPMSAFSSESRNRLFGKKADIKTFYSNEEMMKGYAARQAAIQQNNDLQKIKDETMQAGKDSETSQAMVNVLSEINMVLGKIEMNTAKTVDSTQEQTATNIKLNKDQMQVKRIEDRLGRSGRNTNVIK